MFTRWDGSERRREAPPDRTRFRRELRQEWTDITAMAVHKDNEEERRERVDAVLERLRRQSDAVPEPSAEADSAPADTARKKKRERR